MRRPLLAALAASALLLTVAPPPAVAGDPAPTPGRLGRAGDTGSAAAATAPTPVTPPGASDTLQAVLLVFAGRGETPRAQRLAAGRDMTLMLRDLRLGLDDLSAAERRTARRVLARPTGGGVPLGSPYPPGSNPTFTCPADEGFCVHYATAGDHAPSDPTWVTRTVNTTSHVWDRVVTRGGYRAPRDDSASANHGPDGRLDLYVSALPTGLYGYCTSDDPAAGTSYQVSAYCVVDDDYEGFPVNTPLENLRVTVAHEFFHAVQYAYDWTEDGWLLEGTAAWVEDEIYDAVNDNRQYLATSPLSLPYIPLDLYGEGHQYGNWIWWRFLGERYPSEGDTGLPLVVRSVISTMAGSATGPGLYSTQAMARTLAARGSSVPRAYSQFAVVNRSPARFYEEGGAYPAAPLAVRYRLTDRTERAVAGEQWHLTNDTVRLTPGSNLQRGWRLRVRVDLPQRAYGYRAAVAVYTKAGGKHVTYLPVDADGKRTQYVGFNSNRVRFVEVTLVNASTRYACGQGSAYACEGTPLDDNRVTRAWFKAVR